MESLKINASLSHLLASTGLRTHLHFDHSNFVEYAEEVFLQALEMKKDANHGPTGLTFKYPQPFWSRGFLAHAVQLDFIETLELLQVKLSCYKGLHHQRGSKKSNASVVHLAHHQLCFWKAFICSLSFAPIHGWDFTFVEWGWLGDVPPLWWQLSTAKSLILPSTRVPSTRHPGMSSW